MKAVMFIMIGIFFVLSCDQFNKEKQPEKLSKEKNFELSERCAKAGKTYFDDFWRATTLSAARVKDTYSWDDPEYHYSEKLNTCLIHIRYMEFDKYESSKSRHYNQVIDVFSNKTLIRGWFTRDVKDKDWKETIIDLQDDIPNYTSTKYFSEKKRLFSE